MNYTIKEHAHLLTRSFCNKWYVGFIPVKTRINVTIQNITNIESTAAKITENRQQNITRQYSNGVNI
jgi:hypothetical protein